MLDNSGIRIMSPEERKLHCYRYGGKVSKPIRYVTLLEPYNGVNRDICIAAQTEFSYEEFVAIKKDYTLDVDVISDDVAEIKVKLLSSNTDVCRYMSAIIPAVSTNRQAHTAGLMHNYSLSYDDRTLTIKTCPEWLTNELEWFMEMMSMNGWELTVSDEYIKPDEPVKGWFERFYGAIGAMPFERAAVIFWGIAFSILFICIIVSKCI